MAYRSYSPFSALLVLLTAFGCDSAEELAVDETPAAQAAPNAADSPAQPAATSAKEPEIAETSASTRAVAHFAPPFPDRLELFQPLQRTQGTVQRDDAGETVELKGFINVDQQKVLLAIDGVIAPIHEGGEKYGVQVITIEPPSVVFQRGRNRRKLTLE